MNDKKRVLILCTGNSARSQMAEGLLRHDAGDRFNVASAGTKASFVRPEAIAVMRELGIDMHYDFEDPAAVAGSEKHRLAAFRRVRNQLRAYLRDFIRSTEP
jgi:arsenate reductase